MSRCAVAGKGRLPRKTQHEQSGREVGPGFPPLECSFPCTGRALIPTGPSASLRLVKMCYWPMNKNWRMKEKRYTACNLSDWDHGLIWPTWHGIVSDASNWRRNNGASQFCIEGPRRKLLNSAIRGYQESLICAGCACRCWKFVTAQPCTGSTEDRLLVFPIEPIDWHVNSEYIQRAANTTLTISLLH